MPIEIDVRVIGSTASEAIQELGAFVAHLSSGLGVGAHATNAPDTPEPQAPAVATGNGADKPASRKRSTAAKEPEKAKLDRQAIIDGLTKIYSKGDEDVRLAITKFRDGQGADRLRDLKDDALPAAAELLTELKLAGDQPQV